MYKNQRTSIPFNIYIYIKAFNAPKWEYETIYEFFYFKLLTEPHKFRFKVLLGNSKDRS
jgi:hypothetical protein